MKMIWCSDLHYNFIKLDEIKKFHDSINDEIQQQKSENDEVACMVITGDISEGDKILDHLLLIERDISVPVYFVCGNHDFWNASMSQLTIELSSFSSRSKCKFLNSSSFVKLSETCAIVGQNGWYDTMNGDLNQTSFYMNDWNKIHEFRGKSIHEIIRLSKSLAQVAADSIKRDVQLAVSQGFKEIVIATHVPPFVECCFHKGKKTDAGTLPWYSSGLMGNALADVASENRDVDFKVFCGHTHSPSSVQIFENMNVSVSRAEYGHPSYNVVNTSK